MTFDTNPGAPENAQRIAESLHEHAINELNVRTENVLFTAHESGRVTGTVAGTNNVNFDFDTATLTNLTSLSPTETRSLVRNATTQYWDADSIDHIGTVLEHYSIESVIALVLTIDAKLLGEMHAEHVPDRSP